MLKRSHLLAPPPVSQIRHAAQVKKNGTRLQVKLRKAERGKEWSGIDDVEERRKRRHKRLADSGASTQELLNNMFQDAEYGIPLLRGVRRL